MKVDRLDNAKRSTEGSNSSSSQRTSDLLVREVRRMVAIQLASGVGRRAPVYDVVVGAVEKPLIEAVLYYHGGNQSHAALTLGLARNTLANIMRAHGIRAAAARHAT